MFRLSIIIFSKKFFCIMFLLLGTITTKSWKGGVLVQNSRENQQKQQKQQKQQAQNERTQKQMNNERSQKENCK